MPQIVLRRALLLLLIPAFISCFRYTPSRREMTENKEQTKIAGPEAFKAYQDDLNARLTNLLKERASYVGGSSEVGAYKIGVRDVLKVDVFGFSDLSGESEVDANGMISLPLVGAVKAEGLTPTELQTDLTNKFRRYVKKPIMRLTVNSYNAYKASVVGAIVKPGLVPLKRPGYPLTELLSEAGGLRDNAGTRIFLIPSRSDSNNLQAQIAGVSAESNPAGVEIALDQLVGTLERPPITVPILPGDTIIVPEAGQFRVDGEVERPGAFPVTKNVSTLSALASAGGPTYAANVNEIEVIRDFGSGKKASVTVNLEKVAFYGEPDISLRDGDVVIVPSTPGRFRARQLVEGIRTILRGGVTGSIRYQ